MSKVAVVTGASRGIGFEIAQLLAEQEHQVVAVARSVDPLNKLENTNPDHITAVPTDLTEQGDVTRLTHQVRDKFGNVDILINNAGALINKPFTELSLDDWRSQIESNLISAVHITKQFLPYFNKNAHIVNISSMGGFQGSAKFPGLTAYSVSKGALSILTECLATELSDKNIKVNALCLGAVQTDMLEEAFPGITAPITAEEMGEYITNFALNGSRFYNGKILPVALEDPE
jgi:NAD(P)-dependent dehydrogenase (short-subunit alcohol dehydrogenase family)